MTHGDKPGTEWTQALLAMDEPSILRAVKRMREDAESKIRAMDEPWPPSAFEFAIYGKPAAKLPEHKLLPKPPVKDRRKNIKRLVEMVKRRP